MYNLVCLDLVKENQKGIAKNAKLFGAKVSTYQSLDAAEKQVLSSHLPVIMVVNIDRNQEQKYRMTARLKQRDRTNIIYISSNSTPENRVRWLSYGATTYIKIPYMPEEVLRYATNFATESNTYSINDGTFDIDLLRKTVVYEEEIIKLTPKIFNLLVYFIQNEGRPIAREEIMREVYGVTANITDRNIDTAIKTLRKKTKKSIIKTVRGVGYEYISE